MIRLMLGDCVFKMRQRLKDSSVDSIVTDPPYGLGFMGKEWDIGVPAVDVFEQCLRVLKPGGHLLAFGGSRTYHRLACAVEDAGFEIRDQIMWVYGSGFPKSLDIGKAINKIDGVEFTEKPASGVGFMKPDSEDWNVTKNQLIQKGESSARAKQWEGFGTALKPAHEPIVLARKPLDGNVAENVLKHGVGGLNIDGSRIESGQDYKDTERFNSRSTLGGYGSEAKHKAFKPAQGRYPANLILDGSPQVVGLFPETGVSRGGNSTSTGSPTIKFVGADESKRGVPCGFGDTGSAARFFQHCPDDDPDDDPDDKAARRLIYCGKASKQDRNSGGVKNIHATVKPTELMRYLVKLITPPGGTVLDPFMGSGSTGKAAVKDGFKFIGIELDPEYMEIAKARIHHAKRTRGFCL